MTITVDLFKWGRSLMIFAMFVNFTGAFFEITYDFSFFVRFLNFFTYVFIGYLIAQKSNLLGEQNRNLAFFFLAVFMVLYNPISVIHLGSRTPWIFLNLANGIAFLILAIRFNYLLSPPTTTK